MPSTLPEPFIPALSFQPLMRWYDPLVARLVPEVRMKADLLAWVSLAPGQRVLDLGCGTGTLLALAQQAQPQAEYVGLDIDPAMLAQALARLAQARIELVEGSAGVLPFEDTSFDILSLLLACLMAGLPAMAAEQDFPVLLRRALQANPELKQGQAAIAGAGRSCRRLAPSPDLNLKLGLQLGFLGFSGGMTEYPALIRIQPEFSATFVF